MVRSSVPAGQIAVCGRATGLDLEAANHQMPVVCHWAFHSATSATRRSLRSPLTAAAASCFRGTSRSPAGHFLEKLHDAVCFAGRAKLRRIYSGVRAPREPCISRLEAPSVYSLQQPERQRHEIPTSASRRCCSLSANLPHKPPLFLLKCMLPCLRGSDFNGFPGQANTSNRR